MAAGTFALWAPRSVRFCEVVVVVPRALFQGKADSLSRRDEVIGLIETEMRQDA